VVIIIIAGTSAVIFHETSTVETPPTSTTGVKKAEAEISTGSDGLTVEQRNIKKRLEMENQPGSIKHLYIISAMSGQVILYSTVDGKITSSGKRLSPYHVAAMDNQGCSYELRGIEIKINGEKYRTSEVLQDDGTYGSSISYLYWWDSQGRYHQHYVSGGQIVHVSDQPIAVKSIIINLEQQDVMNK
jgi:hypothetical protein